MPDANKRKRFTKKTKIAWLTTIIIACVVFSMISGVGVAYLASEYYERLYNERGSDSYGDINGDIHLGNNDPEIEETSKAPTTQSPTDVIGDININESNDTSSMDTEFTNVVARTLESVVEINTESVEYSQWSGQYIVTGAGSGVIISKDTKDETVYYVVTNHHVIDSAEDILVRLNNGTEYEASLIATDAITDVALLSIKVEAGAKLTVAETANPESKLLDGQDIYVIGNPLGELGGSVAKGIISKTTRQISVSGVKMSLMQIDAAVNPGNSGGGLFDMGGRLIGIVNAKYTDESVEGLGFAIPIATVKHIVSELATYGYVTGRAGLGLGLADKTYTTGSFMSQTTVTYPTVTADSTVTGAYTNENNETLTFTFSEGDIIFALDGVNVNSTTSLMGVLSEYKVNDKVKVSVYRQVIKTSGNREYYTTEEYTVEVTLIEYAPIISN